MALKKFSIIPRLFLDLRRSGEREREDKRQRDDAMAVPPIQSGDAGLRTKVDCQVS